jgi:hypothetical protein
LVAVVFGLTVLTCCYRHDQEKFGDYYKAMENAGAKEGDENAKL